MHPMMVYVKYLVSLLKHSISDLCSVFRSRLDRCESSIPYVHAFHGQAIATIIYEGCQNKTKQLLSGHYYLPLKLSAGEFLLNNL